MFCPTCGTNNAESAGFCVTCGTRLNPTSTATGDAYKAPPPPPQQQQRPSSGITPPKNWMTEAILATVFGFIFSCLGGIIGIVGIVNASNVNKRFQQGDLAGAENAAKQAKLWTIIAAVITLIGFIITVFVYGAAFLATIATGG